MATAIQPASNQPLVLVSNEALFTTQACVSRNCPGGEPRNWSGDDASLFSPEICLVGAMASSAWWLVVISRADGRSVGRPGGRTGGRAVRVVVGRRSVGLGWLVGSVGGGSVFGPSVVSVDASSCFVCLSVVPIGQSITCDHRPLHLVLRDRHSCM